MDARFDTPLESWGGFSRSKAGDHVIPGRLCYHPSKGVTLELVDNPNGARRLIQGSDYSLETMYGQLVDGTTVTLTKCFISKSSFGMGLGSPTILTVNEATFGPCIDDLDTLQLKDYTVTLSSLSEWTCTDPIRCNHMKDTGKQADFDIIYRHPAPINLTFPNKHFNMRIAHGMRNRHSSGEFVIKWEAGFTISAHQSLPFGTMRHLAWQCENLFSLLIGHRLDIRKITMTPPGSDSVNQPEQSMQLLYHQIGPHDYLDVLMPRMLLPYSEVKDDFPRMVDNWLARSDQAVLATNVFFGHQVYQSQDVDVRFVSATQAAESYHRSFGDALYMNQNDYDKDIQELFKHLPKTIQGDHRQSLKNRLKYGNEYSLRKRLSELFTRMPQNVQDRIGTNVGKFIAKVVDTRNYYTHYDHSSQANAFEGMSAYIAAERLRILVAANLLHDLGVDDRILLDVLERSQDFRHWMSQPLSL